MEKYIAFYDMSDNLILNTYADFRMLIQMLTISQATIKEDIVEVPGSDDVLDYTSSMGDVHYNRRIIHIELAGVKNRREFLTKHSEFQNKLHGQKVKMVFSEELGFFWKGRISVGEVNPYEPIRNIIMDVTVEPYKYDIQSSNEDWLWDSFNFETGIINETKDLLVNGELEVNIYGRRKRVVPKIYCENELELVFNGETYNLPSGTSYVPNIEICEGINTLKFIGNGTVSIEYRGGSL